MLSGTLYRTAALQWLRRGAAAGLCLFGLWFGAAQAANYTFPGTLPGGCSGSGPTYSCGALTLTDGDTITISGNKPATITVNGNFTTNRSTINGAGAASDVTFVVTGALNLGYQVNLNANVTAASVADPGTQGAVGGDLTATSGNIVVGFKTDVGGNITSNTGSITVGNESVIGGYISSNSGAITVKYRSTVASYVSTSGAITIEQEAVVTGALVGGAGAVSVGQKTQVNGAITSSSGTIAIGQEAIASACVKSSNSSSITLGYRSSVNSVCCGATCGNSCVTKDASIAMPPACGSQIIAEYRMDEASWNGTTGEVKDSSGNGAHGTSKLSGGAAAPATTLAGTPAYSSGAQSTCRFGEFDTLSGTIRTLTYVELPAMPVLSTGFSVTAWIRSTDTTASGQRIFVRDDNQDGWAISLGDGGAGKLRFFSRQVSNNGAVTGDGTNPNAGAFAIDTTSVIANNTWYFVAASVDASNKLVTLYVYDTAGALKAKASASFSGTWADGSGMAAIGGETSASGEGQTANFHFRGNIDEVAFFTGAQTQTQIRARLPQVRTCIVSQTCIVDDFASGTLSPTLWNAVKIAGNFTPQVATVGTQKRLRLTDANGNEATMVQLKKWFPAAGNKVVVQFDHYAYGGNGADGIVVVLSDASVSAAPGAPGGSLGYAQASAAGFSGGWLGVGIDEYGNFANTSEGRQGYPSGWTPPSGANRAAGFYPDSVAIRGSGSGTSKYHLLANTGSLSPEIWTSSNTSSTAHRYRITVDNSNSVNAYVTVERDTSATGSSFVTIVPKFDVLGANSLQATVPTNLLLSLTGGTGGSNNIHEIANLSVCANYVTEPGGSSIASAFDCLETGTNSPWVASTSGTDKPLYTKLAGTDFKFDVAALKADGTLEGNYVASGGDTKYVQVELFDNTSPAASCAAYTGAIASQIVPFASGSYSGSAGRALTANFNIPTARAKLLCRVRECTGSTCSAYTAVTAACSTDQFSVRPQQLTVTAPAMTNAGLTGMPAAKAGTAFTLTAAAGVSAGYTGTPTIDNTKVLDHNGATIAPGTLGGSFAPITGTGAGTGASGTSFTYQDVGNIQFPADTVVDSSFTAIDQSNSGCVAGSTSNTLSGGKYGCNIGSPATAKFGRWYPSHYSFSGALTASCAAGGGFTYMGQDALGVVLTLKAHATTGGAASASDPVLSRYTSGYAGLAPVTISGDNGGAAVAVSRLNSPDFPAMPNTALWSAGQMLVNDTYAFSQLASPDGPYDSFKLKAAINDADGATFFNATNETNTTRIRSGQLRLFNAYGSELLPLPVSLEARYWNGSFYITNTLDSCTTLNLSSVIMSNYVSSVATGLAACETQISPTTNQTLNAGKLPSPGLVLSKPGTGNSGSVLLTLNVSAAASGKTCVSTTESNATAANLPWFGSNPTARATFGVYKSPLIYLRENY